MRAWWVVVMAVAACEGRAMTGQVVTQEHFEGIVQDLNDARDEIDALRAEIDALRAEVAATQGDGGGNVLARVECPAEVEGLGREIDVPGVIVEIPGPAVGHYLRWVGSDAWDFVGVIGTPGPLRVPCYSDEVFPTPTAEHLIVRL